MTPEAAPEIIMDARGFYWRRYPEHLSMVPTTDDNEAVPEPYVVYLPAEFGKVYWRSLALRAEAERAALLAELEHTREEAAERERVTFIWKERANAAEVENVRLTGERVALDAVLAMTNEKYEQSDRHVRKIAACLAYHGVTWDDLGETVVGLLTRGESFQVPHLDEMEAEAVRLRERVNALEVEVQSADQRGDSLLRQGRECHAREVAAVEQVAELIGVFDDWVIQTEPLSTAKRMGRVTTARAFLASVPAVPSTPEAQ